MQRRCCAGRQSARFCSPHPGLSAWRVRLAGEVPPVARFEVVFAGAPCPLELASALESLSVACSHCGEEINMLQDHAVAQRYLELRGWT
jgi:hypothetical protein